MSTRLYVEGGGDRKPSRTRCRQAFQAFLRKAELAGGLPRIFASGGRQQAYDDFRHALGASRADDSVVLLVDSEGPVATGTGPWRHLKDRDGWDKPAGATNDHVHLMVQCMEAWFFADKDCLAAFFGPGFNRSALPRNPDIEQIAKTDVLDGLKSATRQCRSKGEYGKGRHSFEILAEVDPAKVVAASKHARRLIETLISKAN